MMGQTESHFSFKSYKADIPHGRIEFCYQLTDKGTSYDFLEILEFTPPAGYTFSRSQDTNLTSILDYLHILLGISYWKLVCTPDLQMPIQSLNEKQASFWNTVYTKGLGEFYYKNSIDFRGLVQFPFVQKIVPAITSGDMQERSLVMLGGGKDSIVTSELLKKAGKPFSLFCVNPKPIHREIAQLIGVPLCEIKRTIDPTLLTLNKKPGMYNGHVPITAITSGLGMLAAALYNFRYVIASNEESANYGNVEYLESQINHQWSKSYEFEKLFSDYKNTYITRGISYFSLMRPLTEMHIVKMLCEHAQYLQKFSSCNRNFHIQEGMRSKKWCGDCAKCAFVYLLLASILPKNEVISIFGDNLLNKNNLLVTYRELLGIVGVKPFECVGTPEEVLAAFELVLERGEYSGDIVVKELADSITKLFEKKKGSTTDVFKLSEKHLIPKEFTGILKNL